MSCDDDVNSCYDDVTGDWIFERHHCLMYATLHYMNFPLYFIPIGMLLMGIVRCHIDINSMFHFA